MSALMPRIIAMIPRHCKTTNTAASQLAFEDLALRAIGAESVLIIAIWQAAVKQVLPVVYLPSWLAVQLEIG